MATTDTSNVFPSLKTGTGIGSFVYDQPARRVIFGAGSIERLPEEVKRLGTKALVLSTPEQRADADRVATQLGDIAVGVFTNAAMHVPIDTARAARAEAARLGADVYVTVGGGSTTGLGKVIALETGQPIVAVPTTFAGSEMTPIYGITEPGLKKTARDNKVLPRTVIYDPVLTLTLPVHIAGPSGMNAIAHCVEALYAPDGNPIISLMAAEGIRALGQALPAVVAEPTNLAARADALYGAWLAGICLGATSMSIHHKLCHTLGGTFNLPHADVHTVILPHATAYNASAAPDAMRRIADALDTKNAAQGIYDLIVKIGAPIALKDIGMPADGLDKAAKLATENPYYNPKPIEYHAVRELLEHAYHGTRPS
jgi:alcohol dehydrogenase class IV